MADVKERPVITRSWWLVRKAALTAQYQAIYAEYQKGVNKFDADMRELNALCPHEHTTRGRCGEDSFFTCDDCGKEL